MKPSMKTGILTFHCAHNYGAVLQCYALQQTLMDMGHDAEVINFAPEYLTEEYKIFDCRRISGKNPKEFLKNFVLEFLKYGKRIKRTKAFNSFINNELKLSSLEAGRNVPDKYDVYVIGSDQVWNIDLTGGAPEKAYFADFPFDKGNRRYISYAASMGGYKIGEDGYRDYIRQALERFDAVSVREERMVDKLQALISQKSIETVLDPTMMADVGIWDNVLRKPKLKKKYVLVYRFIADSGVMGIARRIAAELGAEVVEISQKLNIFYRKEHYVCASPEEFLGWFKYADYVITTSFHGTAFSLIFQRPFYCIRYNSAKDYRSKALLDKLGLGDRMIDVKDSPQCKEIDYTEVTSVLTALKRQSLEFLGKNLK